MFAKACEIAAEFTRPVIVSTRLVDGTVNASCGSFVILNDEGWIMTAGHMFDSFVKFQMDQNKIKEVDGVNEARMGVQNPDRKFDLKKDVAIPKLPSNQLNKDEDWITNHSFWWAWDGVRLANVYVNRQIDIAIGKLEPFDKKWIRRYPVFRNPDTIRPGTSLCRFGFPFNHIESEFDEKVNAFRIKNTQLPLPLFPNECMHTRIIAKGKSKDGLYDMTYVETSTPGLKGQSGGPIVDVNGNIYAMQVVTNNIPLGFQPTVEVNGQKVVENQFLNVGLGVHVKTIQTVLRDHNVKFKIDGDENTFRIID